MLRKEKGRETIVYFSLFFSIFRKALYFVGLPTQQRRWFYFEFGPRTSAIKEKRLNVV